MIYCCQIDRISVVAIILLLLCEILKIENYE
jgi:hypothetical protein